MVSCADGSLFGFGRNDFGQIGVGDLVDRKEPTLVDLPGLMGKPAKEIACGQYHTIVLTQSGTAWVSGKNDYGQLGLPSNETQARFVGLDVGTKSSSGVSSSGGSKSCDASGTGVTTHIASLKTGYYHSLALLDNGCVLSCSWK